VHNDDNRGEDGKQLRVEFLEVFGIDEGDDIWVDADASMLEVLVALSRRVSFESYSTPANWFWKLIANLDLSHYTDANYDQNVEAEVDEALELVITRRYAPDGRGGLFPHRMRCSNQRYVELWYQMSTYLEEGERVANGPIAD
jgi:hypothetical protein